MLKKVFVIMFAMYTIFMSGCGMFGGVSKEEMESVIAERDFYIEAYQKELEHQIELQDEILNLEVEIEALEQEKIALEQEKNELEEELAFAGGRTLEDFYNQPEVKESLDAEFERVRVNHSHIFKDLGYEVSGNTLIYWYYYANQIEDTEALVERIENSLSKNELAGLALEIESESGVTGITVGYIYYNADGSIIYQTSYSTE